MIKTFLSAKLHNVHVTKCNPDYIGSITLDTKWLRRLNIQEFEQVHVWNYAGPRIITYVIAGNNKECQLNGSAAIHFNEGDKIIICSFAQSEQLTWTPKILTFDAENNIIDNNLPEF